MINFSVKFKPSYKLAILFTSFFIILIYGVITTNLPIYLKIISFIFILYINVKYVMKFCLLLHSNSLICLTYHKNKFIIVQKNNNKYVGYLSDLYKNSLFIILYLQINNSLKTFIIFKDSITNKDFRSLSTLIF